MSEGSLESKLSISSKIAIGIAVTQPFLVGYGVGYDFATPDDWIPLEAGAHAALGVPLNLGTVLAAEWFVKKSISLKEAIGPAVASYAISGMTASIKAVGDLGREEIRLQFLDYINHLALVT